jgi:hypothetical protein
VGRLGEIALNDSKVGYNEFDFLKKIKNTDPLMDAKLKSEPFFARLASKFSESANMTQKIFFNKSKRYQKTQNFTLISNPLKKLLKNAPKK